MTASRLTDIYISFVYLTRTNCYIYHKKIFSIFIKLKILAN